MPKEEKSYSSPTTPGLMVFFRDYVIEQVCLNVNRKIGPRFWKDGKYWAPKYKREIRGMSNLKKRFGNFDDVLLRSAIIDVVKELNIKSLSATKTINKIERAVKKKYEQKKQHRENLARAKPTVVSIDGFENFAFPDLGAKSKLAKLKEIEEREKED